MRKKINFAFLRRRWQLKLLSFCIALSLWYFVAGEDQIDLIVTVPVEVQNLPADLVIANQYKKDIEVSIRGPKRLVQEMRQQNVSRPLDLSKAVPGTMVIQNNADVIPFPRGITVRRVQPDTITLLLDQLIQKPFTIAAITEGKPAAGFVLDSLELKPQQITISGPRSVLDSQPNLQTSLINLEGLDRSVTLQVHLKLNEVFLQLIGETVIEAKINLKEVMVKKKVANIPINIKDAPSGAKVKPTMVTVEAEIPEQLVRASPELSMLFRAAVSAPADLIDGKVPVTVNGVSLPGYGPIIIRSISPDRVQLLH